MNEASLFIVEVISTDMKKLKCENTLINCGDVGNDLSSDEDEDPRPQVAAVLVYCRQDNLSQVEKPFQRKFFDVFTQNIIHIKSSFCKIVYRSISSADG